MLRKTILFILLALLVVPLWAVPRYTLRDGVTCSMCHVSPEGGGMRRTYASYRFGKEGPDIELGEYIRFDAEARVWALDTEIADERRFTFDVMDYRVRLNPTLDDVIDAVVSWGRFGFDEASLRLYLPMNFYARVGLFRPPFGFNSDDHLLATREPFGFDPIRWFESGLEVGWFNKGTGTHVSAGFYNGGEDAFDIDKGKAASFHFGQWLSPVYFGGSYWYNEEQEAATELYGTTWAASGFLGIDLPFDIGLLGEFLFREEKLPGDEYTDDMAFWAGLDFWLGDFELFLLYDQLMPNEDSGSLMVEQSYFTGRFIWHAHSFIDLELAVKYGLEDETPTHYYLQLWSIF